MIRDCFAAGPGNYLVSADFSQIEIRIAALLSGDATMKEIFHSGDDYHLRTAKLISQVAWGIEPDDVTDEHRRIAKGYNFGLMYGMGDPALAKSLGISVREASKIRKAILGKLVGYDRWTKQCLNEARRTGYTWTWWQGKRARRRSLFDIAGSDDFKRSIAENASFNTQVQGSANEYNTASLIEIVRWIAEDCMPAKVVVVVHDSIVFEAAEEVLDEVIDAARQIMTSWDSGDVPLEVDVEVGKQWGSMVKVPPGQCALEAFEAAQASSTV